MEASMANYKVEIGKRFGVFHATFFAATPGAKAPAIDKQPTFKAIDDVLGFVRSSYADTIEEDDAVFFRGIAYGTLGELEQQIRRSPY